MPFSWIPFVLSEIRVLLTLLVFICVHWCQTGIPYQMTSMSCNGNMKGDTSGAGTSNYSGADRSSPSVLLRFVLLSHFLCIVLNHCCFFDIVLQLYGLLSFTTYDFASSNCSYFTGQVIFQYSKLHEVEFQFFFFSYSVYRVYSSLSVILQRDSQDKSPAGQYLQLKNRRESYLHGQELGRW
jgi:hypothetical protein